MHLLAATNRNEFRLWSLAWRAVLFGIAYLGCAIAGRFCSPPGVPFVTFWLPSGLFVAVLLRQRTRHWVMFVAAGYCANLGFDFANGQTLTVGLLFATGNCLEALVGAGLVRRWVAPRPGLSSVREVAGLVGLAGMVGPMVSATIGTATVVLLEGSSSFTRVWPLWWSGDVLGVVLTAPLILGWRSRAGGWLTWKFSNREFEAAAVLAGVGCCTVVAFVDAWHPGIPLKYTLIPCVLWMAFRFGLRATVMANVVVALCGSWLTARGHGDIAASGLSVPGQIASLQLFLAVVALTSLFMAAVLAERAQAEAALRESDANLRALVESATQSILLIDLEGTVLEINEVAARRLGRTPVQMVGTCAFDHVSAEVTASRRSRLAQVIATGQSVRFEDVRSGRVIDQSLVPVRDAGGNIVRVAIFAEDITERRRSDGILQARARLLEFAATHSLEELLVATLDEAEALTGSQVGFYHFLEADQKTLALQAWSTRTSRDLCRAEGKGRHYDVAKAGVWVDCIRQRRPVMHNDYAALPHRQGLPPGHSPVVRELVVPVFRGDLIVAILGVGNKTSDYTEADVDSVSRLADLAWDIAERKRGEEALHRSREHWRKLVTTIPDYIALLDPEGRFVFLNRYAKGFSEKDIAGRNSGEFVSAAARSEYQRNFDECKRTKRTQEFEYTALGDNDSTRTYDGYMVPIVERDEVTNVMSIARDVTARKVEETHRDSTLELLRLINASRDTRAMVQAAVAFFRRQSGCEAVGVRVFDGEDYPYFEVEGFPARFVQMENKLCARDATGGVIRDSVGNPVLECMCGNVICGRFDPAKPFFTSQGSFWTNGTTALLASTIAADRQARTRNRCNGEGYESVALLPLRFGEERLGLLQLNDRRPGRFTAEAIAHWERLTSYLAAALAKLRAEDAIKQALAEKEVLLKEVHHRVKNNLQVVAGLLDLQAERLADPQVRMALKESKTRIKSIALVHETLYHSAGLARLDFKAYVQGLVAQLFRAQLSKGRSVRFDLRMADVTLDLPAAVPCGLIINELVTNALKHAFPEDQPTPENEIVLTWEDLGAHWRLTVADNGPGLPAGLDWTHAPSLGLRLVQLLTQQLKGTARLEPGRGCRFVIEFPKPPIR